MYTFRTDVKKQLEEEKNPNTVIKQTKLYHVQIGAFSSKVNAESQLAKAKAYGFTDAFIKHE
jgi:cell division septation protein DedD